jgi:hypothetical protein
MKKRAPEPRLVPATQAVNTALTGPPTALQTSLAAVLEAISPKPIATNTPTLPANICGSR